MSRFQPIFVLYILFYIIEYDDNTQNVDGVTSCDTIICQIYICLFCIQCVIKWTDLISILQQTSSRSPLIQIMLEMVGDTFRLHLVFIMSLGSDTNNLSYFCTIPVCMFRSLLSQQEWDLISILIILFKIVGGVLMLNLLILLMASTFERFREAGNKKGK